ncbi:MAG: aldose 1-epimerase [Parvibaculum sp.]|jgi:aldose 1-epimerase|uniref:aldose 1-epimerase n=1 Tax=Parvibaculum sp. TaxID=2024848 RepID=UPI002850CE3F|nr:aldose 1-epimerase [Parvibaculum sp.]MDR3499357.1 aldose 1-epimerase [Parvibaculum sp.]
MNETPAETSRRLRLASGALEAAIAPGAGGSLLSFRAQGQEMMREAANHADPLAAACFPMVPFSGRIARGRFAVEGRAVALTPDPIAEPHAIHGFGWRRPWRVEEAAETSAMLAFEYDAAEWPWSFAARQRLDIDETSLSIRLELENRSDEPMPAGLGLHPYFPSRLTARLKASLPFIWEATPDRIPTRRAPVQAVNNFSRGRRVAPLTLDHDFSGSDAAIEIEWEDRPLALRIERPGSDHTIVYTPQERDYFCVEPASHVPDAVNRSEDAAATGLRLLAPGETMTLACRFVVYPR